MEDQNQQNSTPAQTSNYPDSSVSEIKVIQPPQSFIEGAKLSQQQAAPPVAAENGTTASGNPRIDAAIQSLKQCKAQGLTYYDATQSLEKQGFSQSEIEQASTQFVYSSATAPSVGSTPQEASLDQAFAEAATKDKVEDITKQTLQKDMLFSFLGGRSFAGQYFGGKAARDYAALKDQELADKSNPSDPNNPSKSQNGTRVYQRHRAVQYYAMLALLPIAFAVLNLITTIEGAVKSAATGNGHIGLSVNDVSLYLIPLIICVVCGSMASLLMLARKESTIIRTIYLLLGFDLAVFAVLAILFRSVTLVIFGLLTLLPGYWISRKVGLLSQLK